LAPAEIATTQPTSQIKIKQLGWRGIIIGKKNTTHQVPHFRQFQATWEADFWYANLFLLNNKKYGRRPYYF
jgi:hypothetical protein